MKCITFTIVTLLVVSCNSYKDIVQDTAMCAGYVDNNISEVINIEEYRSLDSIQKYGRTSFSIDSNLTKNIVKLSDDWIYIYIYNKETNVHQEYTYNNTGKLQNVAYSHTNAKIGNETHYDEEGNIVEVINHDKGYKICWAQALEIVKHKKPTNYLLGGIERTQLTNEQGNTILCWVVGVQEPNKEDTIGRKYMYYIDGTTGKFIKKVQYTSNPG